MTSGIILYMTSYMTKQAGAELTVRVGGELKIKANLSLVRVSLLGLILAISDITILHDI
jgi:hypothetical protein